MKTNATDRANTREKPKAAIDKSQIMAKTTIAVPRPMTLPSAVDVREPAMKPHPIATPKMP